MNNSKIRESDSKGRITLGQPFANKHFVVEYYNDKIIIAELINTTSTWIDPNESNPNESKFAPPPYNGGPPL